VHLNVTQLEMCPTTIIKILNPLLLFVVRPNINVNHPFSTVALLTSSFCMIIVDEPINIISCAFAELSRWYG